MALNFPVFYEIFWKNLIRNFKRLIAHNIEVTDAHNKSPIIAHTILVYDGLKNVH